MDVSPTTRQNIMAPLRRPHRPYALSRERAIRWILSSMMFLALWRASGMWFGYPANFDVDGAADLVPLKVILYSLVPLLMLYATLEPNRIFSYLRRVSPLVLIVAIGCLLSVFFSYSFGASIRGLAAVAVLTTAPLLYRLRYGSVVTFRFLSNFAIFLAFFNVAYTLVFPQFAIMGGSYAGMFRGAFYHKNLLGQYCAVAVVTLWSFPNFSKGITSHDLLRWAAIICLIALLFAARSSTAVVMLIAGLAILAGMSIVQRLPKNGAKPLSVAIMWLALAVLSAIAYAGIAASIAESFGKDLTFSGRTNIWGQLIPLIWNRPFFGHGFALFRQPEIMAQYVSVSFAAKSTHNTYLELFLNIGIPATVAFILFLLTGLFQKMSFGEGTAEWNAVRKKEIAILILVMLGASTEAGMLIAPFIVWPQTVISLVDNERRASPKKRLGNRFR